MIYCTYIWIKLLPNYVELLNRFLVKKLVISISDLFESLINNCNEKLQEYQVQNQEVAVEE